MKSFKIENDHIYVDGRQEKIVSGAMHYFRIHPDYWEDRLLKLRECGCNCVETIYSAPIDTLPIKYDSLPMANTPTFYKYVFNAEEVCDTVLHPAGFERGVAFINGFNLGRHWNIENSENKLFIPAPFIKEGENEIVIFDVMPTGAEKSVRLSEF